MSGYRRFMPLAILPIVSAALPFRTSAQEILVEIRNLSPHEIETSGFALNGEQDVQIQAVGAERRERWDRRDWQDWNERDRHWIGNAWILDAETRDVVWELRYADTERRSGDQETFEGTVRLTAGEYIVHYASYSGEREWNGWGDDRDSADWYDDGISEEFHITIRGEGRKLSGRDISRARDAFNESAFISFIGLRDEERESVGFRLGRATEVEIYAIGEVIDEGTYDYAWLIDAETGEVVWRLEERGSRRGGGARKNRMARRVLRLEAGSYAVLVFTDDSHDTGDWNAPPPYDPEFWGLTIRMTDSVDPSSVETFDYRRAAPENAFVSLTGLGDGDMVSEGFTLNRRMDVRVYAIGEGTDRRMYDYGRILDASTRETIWEMDLYETEHAGGAAKNRMVNEIITLEPGNYIVYYATDDSHSAYEWNSAPPVDEEAWGIRLMSLSGPVDRGALSEYDPASDPSIVAQLIEIRDHAHRRQRFTLDRESEVRIYALGEGTGGEMYDYAWIEEVESGRSVWEMTYRSTERAGGARKNRLYNDTIRLEAGEYTLRYESDGSHSFGDWNAAPPADPFNYGVTLYREPRR